MQNKVVPLNEEKACLAVEGAVKAFADAEENLDQLCYLLNAISKSITLGCETGIIKNPNKMKSAQYEARAILGLANDLGVKLHDFHDKMTKHALKAGVDVPQARGGGCRSC